MFQVLGSLRAKQDGPVVLVSFSFLLSLWLFIFIVSDSGSMYFMVGAIPGKDMVMMDMDIR